VTQSLNKRELIKKLDLTMPTFTQNAEMLSQIIQNFIRSLEVFSAFQCGKRNWFCVYMCLYYFL